MVLLYLQLTWPWPNKGPTCLSRTFASSNVCCFLHSSILPSQNDFGSVHPEIVPPRRSSRRKQRQHQHHHRRQSSSRRQSNPAWRPASSVYDSSDREPSPLTPQYKLASSNRFGGAAADQISPPSSPEFSAVQHGYVLSSASIYFCSLFLPLSISLLPFISIFKKGYSYTPSSCS